MNALRFTLTRVVPFRAMLKSAVLASLIVFAPLYGAFVSDETGHPMLDTLKGLLLLLVVLFGGWALWWLFLRIRFRRGGPGLGPPPPQVREPRPPGGRPPALSAAARPEKDQE